MFKYDKSIWSIFFGGWSMSVDMGFILGLDEEALASEIRVHAGSSKAVEGALDLLEGRWTGSMCRNERLVAAAMELFLAKVAGSSCPGVVAGVRMISAMSPGCCEWEMVDNLANAAIGLKNGMVPGGRRHVQECR